MNQALVTQVREIRRQAADLKERAQRLLDELRQIPDINPPAQSDDYIPKNGRIILHVR